MFLDLHKGWGRIQDTILLGEQCRGTRRYNPSTNWLDMCGSKQVILGANNNIKGTEQFRLSGVPENPMVDTKTTNCNYSEENDINLLFDLDNRAAILNFTHNGMS